MNNYNKIDLSRMAMLANGFNAESTNDQEDIINEDNGDNNMEVNNKVRELGYEFNSKNKFVCKNTVLIPFINLINDLEEKLGKIDFTKHVGIDKTTLNSFINKFKMLATDRRTYTCLIYNQLISYAFIANDSKHLNVNEDSVWKRLNSSSYYTSDNGDNKIIASIYLISNFFTTTDILNKETEIKEAKDDLLIINLCLTRGYLVDSFNDEEKKFILDNFELFKNHLKDVDIKEHTNIMLITDSNIDKYASVFKNYNILEDGETIVICRNCLSSFKTLLNKEKTKESNNINLNIGDSKVYKEFFDSWLSNAKIAKYIHLRNEISYVYNNSDKISYNVLNLILNYIENHAGCKDHEYLLLDIINDLNLNEYFKEYYVNKTEKRKKQDIVNNKHKTIKVTKLSRVLDNTTKSFKIENFDIKEIEFLGTTLNLDFVLTYINGIGRYFAYDPNTKMTADLYEIKINERYENNTLLIEEVLFNNISYNTFKYDRMSNMIYLNNEMFIGSKVVFLSLHQLVTALHNTPKGDTYYINNQQPYKQQYVPHQHVPNYNNVQQPPYSRAQAYNPYGQPSFRCYQQPFNSFSNNETTYNINDYDSYLNNEFIDLKNERKVIIDNLKNTFNDLMDSISKL